MRRASIALTLGLCLASTAPASAQDLFNSGQAWDDVAFAYSLSMGFENFHLTSRSHVTAIRYYAAWWLDVPPNPYLGYAGVTTWGFFHDQGGVPGAQVAGGVTAGTWQAGVGGDNDDGQGMCGGIGPGIAPCTEHTLPIDVYLDSGDYWLGLMNGTAPSYDHSWYFWASSINGGAAFALEGNVVPEPGTMVLLGSGVLGLLAPRRRHRTARSTPVA